MSTFNELAERVDTLLHGYSIATEATTWLTTSATSTSTTLTLHDVGVLGRGFIQIDDEILYVHSVDPANTQVTISPWGRGQRGTTKAAHEANAKVTVAPLFPRNEIKRAINDTINAMYPNVFGTAQTEFTYVANRTTYDLPDAAEQIQGRCPHERPTASVDAGCSHYAGSRLSRFRFRVPRSRK
jgi:hypothetical protein